MEPHEIRAAFDRLQRALHTIDAPIVSHLQPGLTAAEVDAQFDGQLALHPHVVAWFSAHNGTDIEQPTAGLGVHRLIGQQLCGHWYIMSLADTVRSHRGHRDALEETGNTDWLPRAWYPVMQHLTGAVLCIDTEDSDGCLYVYSVHAELPADPPRRSFANLADFADTYAHLIAESVVASDPDEGQRIDYDRLPDFLNDGRPQYW